MPSRAVTLCTYPGCTAHAVKAGRCEKHPPGIVDRDPRVQRMYSTARWKQLRRQQLSTHPWCAACLAETPVRYTPATDVDHIDRHNGDARLFFGGKLQSLCHACHSRKTAAEVGISTPGKGGQ